MDIGDTLQSELELNLYRGTVNNRNGTKELNQNAVLPFSTQFQTISIKLAQEKNLKARRNLLEIYAKHLINFKRSILINRRRWQQKIQRRQALLRSFFMRYLTELGTTFLEVVSVPKFNDFERREESAEKCSVINRCISLSIPTRRIFEDEMGLMTEQHWLSNFHMNKSSFEWICDELKYNMQQSTYFRGYFSYEKQIALSLYAFSNGIESVELTRLFKIPSRSTIYKFLNDFAEIIFKKWVNKFLVMPATADEFDEIGSSFSKASNMPSVVIGVLGICELTTKSTKLSTSIESQDSKIIMQALIDDKLLFRKIKMDTNQPTLFLEDVNELTGIPPKLINGHPVSRLVVTSDTSYPLKKWIMHKYVHPVEPYEFDFNEAIDNVLVFKNHALLRLFSRWRILKNNGDLNGRTMEKIVLACCILHNYLEVNGETFDNSWSKDLDMGSIEFSMSTKHKAVLNERSYSWNDVDAIQLREFLGRTISATEM